MTAPDFIPVLSGGKHNDPKQAKALHEEALA